MEIFIFEYMTQYSFKAIESLLSELPVNDNELQDRLTKAKISSEKLINAEGMDIPLTDPPYNTTIIKALGYIARIRHIIQTHEVSKNSDIDDMEFDPYEYIARKTILAYIEGNLEKQEVS